MRILVTGAAGQLGLALIREILGREEDVFSLFLTVKGEKEWASLYDKMEREKLLTSSANIHGMDITDEIAVRTTCHQFQPDVIINCSAYTLVEEAEDEENLEEARRVNVCGVSNLAKVAKEVSAKFIHISTDYVFDGEKEGSYLEEDEKNPINAYGRTKADGEEEALKHSDKCFIIRTSWLYGEGKNFVKTMLDLAGKQKEIKVVDNQFGSPTSAKEVARLILYLMNTEKYGIWHGSAEGETSWYGFAEEIMRLTKKEVDLIPISDEVYKTKAKRPRNSVLSKEKLNSETDFRMKEWNKALKEFLEEFHLLK